MSSDDHLARFIASSIGSVAAETITLPSDVAKTRLQVQVPVNGVLQYKGMFDVWKQTTRTEGLRGNWKGLAPALLRQVSYSSLSMVLYEPIRNALVPEEAIQSNNIPFGYRLLAAGTAGGISIAVMNPTEVIKTQMMTSQTETKSMLSVFRHVMHKDGALGFWAGVRPNVMRTFLVQAAEIGVYDHAKHSLMPYTGDNFANKLGASTIAGFASALTSTPADVIKTRFMNQAGGEQVYSGVVDAAKKISTQEGIAGLYKGFVPILVRKIAWVSAFFVTYEEARKLMHIEK